MAASALKQLIEKHWSQIPGTEVVSLKTTLLNYLANKGCECEQQVLKMVIMLLVKVVKLAWNDQPSVQSIV